MPARGPQVAATAVDQTDGSFPGWIVIDDNGTLIWTQTPVSIDGGTGGAVDLAPLTSRVTALEGDRPTLARGHGDTLSLNDVNLIDTSVAPTALTVGEVDYELADVTLPAVADGAVFVAVVSPDYDLQLLGPANGDANGLVLERAERVLQGRCDATEWTITSLTTPKATTVEIADPGDGVGIPAYTRRANTVYLSATGNDGNNGLTSSQPWATLQTHVTSGALLPDTEVVVLDGTVDLSTALLYSDVPANLTIRAANYRQATIRGPAVPASGTDSILVYGYGAVQGLELYGLTTDRWQMEDAGSAVVLLESDGSNSSSGFRMVGCDHGGYGWNTSFCHLVYFSGGATAHGDFLIADNKLRPAFGCGSSIMQLNGGSSMPTSGEVTRNDMDTTDTSARYLMQITNCRADGAASAIRVHDNDLHGVIDKAMFYFTESGTENGVGTDFIIEDNRINQRDSGTSDYVFRLFPTGATIVSGTKANHDPTIRNNTTFTPGTAFDGLTGS